MDRTEYSDDTDPMVTGSSTGNANRDPISGEPGSHPVGTGLGAGGGATAGAVIGSMVGGPVGGVIGAAIGGVSGGVGGHEAGEAVNPTDPHASRATSGESVSDRIERAIPGDADGDGR